MDPAATGIVLSYSVFMIMIVEATSRFSADLEIEMVSLERIMTYTKLKPEASLTSVIPPPPQWPQLGEIRMENVSLAYDVGEPFALKSVTFEVNPSEKVGIVGRTGAGKSSLVQALFRLTEPQGKIYIDGICVNYLGLHELRDKMSIIPQDPILFDGSLRDNLDPLHIYSDHQIRSALHDIHMEEVVIQMKAGLRSRVSERGSNFSVGQRQLLCLARAILKRNKILILDEATANVDKKTDELIQQTIRRTFQNCTVLIIAHRLRTIMDSDRILVMRDGHVVEFDRPSTLLENKQSAFSHLVNQTSKTEARETLKIATNTQQKKD